jgi:adenosylcobinamide-phosphate synthase
MYVRFFVLSAALLDLSIGDPPSLPHPVGAVGLAVRLGEPIARRAIADEAVAGAALTVAIVGAAALAGFALARFAPVRTVLAASTLACGSLLDHLEPVRGALERNELEAARLALARCVGRETESLGAGEIARAAIETAAESLCDGVVAPLFYLRCFGLTGAFAYKAINTLDSLIGHFEPPYERFGTFAARLDDIANWIPARLSALLIVVCAPFGGGSCRDAFDVWRSDGERHRSPNAGQSEAAMAGALGVRLGGVNVYDGVAHRSPALGERFGVPQAPDVRRAEQIVFSAAVLAAACAAW